MFIKKCLMKKICIYLFNKKTATHAVLGSKQKLLATAKQLIRKNFVCCLKNQAIFYTADVQICLTSSAPLVCFHSLFNTLPPLQQKYFLNDPK